MVGIVQRILKAYGYDKEINNLPNAETLNKSNDWVELAKSLNNIEEVEWLDGVIDGLDKERLYLTFTWHPRSNVEVLVKSGGYIINVIDEKKVAIKNKTLNYEALSKFSLALEESIFIVVRITSANISMYAFSEEPQIFPRTGHYDTTKDKVYNRFCVEYRNNLHANANELWKIEEGDDRDGRGDIQLSEILEDIDIPDCYNYGTRFCSGNIRDTVPLVFFPATFLKIIYDALTNQNFDSPLFPIENHMATVRFVIDSYLHYLHHVYKGDVFKKWTNIVYKDGQSQEHLFTEQCKCNVCRAMRKYNKINKRFKFLPYVDTDKMKIGGNIINKDIDMQYGFSLGSSSTTSRFANMFDINSLIVRQATIVGLGNLGSRLALDMARIPIINLNLVDGDHVGTENILTQQFDGDDLLQKKASVLIPKIRKIQKIMGINNVRSTLNNFQEFFKPADITDEQLAIREEVGLIDDYVYMVDNAGYRLLNVANSNIIVIAVDNMEDRRSIYRFYKMIGIPTMRYGTEYLRPIYIDVSMSPSNIRVYSFYFDNKLARDKYEKFINFDSTEENVCGETSHSYMGATVSAVVQRVLIDASVNKELPFFTHITKDLEIIKYPTNDLFSPMYVLNIVDRVPGKCILMEDGIDRNLLVLGRKNCSLHERRVIERYHLDPDKLSNKKDLFLYCASTPLNKFNTKYNDGSGSNVTTSSEIFSIDISSIPSIRERLSRTFFSERFIEMFENGTMFGKTNFCINQCRNSRNRALCISDGSCLGIKDFDRNDKIFCEKLLDVKESKSLWSCINDTFNSTNVRIWDISFVDPSTITNYRETSNQLDDDLIQATDNLNRMMRGENNL